MTSRAPLDCLPQVDASQVTGWIFYFLPDPLPQVADVFDNSTMTAETGVSTTISVPQSAEFAITDGKQAKCQFTYSTINLRVRAGWLVGLGLAGAGWGWLGLAGAGWGWLGLAGAGWGWLRGAVGGSRREALLARKPPYRFLTPPPLRSFSTRTAPPPG
jgi:hypothetical protein